MEDLRLEEAGAVLALIREKDPHQIFVAQGRVKEIQIVREWVGGRIKKLDAALKDAADESV